MQAQLSMSGDMHCPCASPKTLLIRVRRRLYAHIVTDAQAKKFQISIEPCATGERVADYRVKFITVINYCDKKDHYPARLLDPIRPIFT